MSKGVLLSLIATLLALPCAAHGVVDLAVRFVAPEFVAGGSTTSIDVVVDALAFDSAFGATLFISINETRVTGSDPAWRCTSGPELIQCTAEELTGGPHAIHLSVKVPVNASTLRALATVDSLGSVDPEPANNKGNLLSRVFDSSRCRQNAPEIVGDLTWTTVPEALSYAMTTAWQGLQGPLAVAIEASGVIVSDPPARKLYVFDPTTQTLAPLPLFGDIVESPPTLDGGIVISPGHYLWVSDRGTHSVRYALPPPRYMYFAAKFDAPAAIAVDDKSNFFITDGASGVIHRMTYNSSKFDFAVSTLAGNAGLAGFADGRGAAARFSDPAGIAVDSSGNVFVCDRGNHVIRRITADGTATTLAGTAGVAGHEDGNAASSLFNRPFGIAIDAWGNLYVTEEGNHDIRKIAPNGRVSTVAEGLDRPAFLAIAPDGTLWIPDSGSGRLLHAAVASSERRRAVRH